MISEYSSIESKITCFTQNKDLLSHAEDFKVKPAFDSEVIDFLSCLSKTIFGMAEAKLYTDVISFAFYIREQSILKLKQRFIADPSLSEESTDHKLNSIINVGRGVAFHITPSNIPVNFAYSMITGLLTGNINILKIPSKEFAQVALLIKAINQTLAKYPNLKRYIFLLSFAHDQDVSSYFSSICDLRIIWGGDQTVNLFRSFPLKPRAAEVCFADRYSVAMINSEAYFSLAADSDDHADTDRFIRNFYNDTYLNDQNACSSPVFLIFTGDRRDECSEDFYNRLHDFVESHYSLASITCVNKLEKSYLASANIDDLEIIQGVDNFITRIKIHKISNEIFKFKGNCGLFFEYSCADLSEIIPLIDNTKCQTIAYLGDMDKIRKIVACGIKGVDRVVPIGQTLDFDLIWDGYNLFNSFTRSISFR